jgi:heme/copper-type cytochrome/quinol oxidase subunit 2
VTIDVGYAGGSITGGGRRSAALGQAVVIKVTSDIADEVHLHGYDKKADAAPGTVATITFVADKPGIFEVELEKKGLKLFELEVK